MKKNLKINLKKSALVLILIFLPFHSFAITSPITTSTCHNAKHYDLALFNMHPPKIYHNIVYSSVPTIFFKVFFGEGDEGDLAQLFSLFGGEEGEDGGFEPLDYDAESEDFVSDSEDDDDDNVDPLKSHRRGDEDADEAALRGDEEDE